VKELFAANMQTCTLFYAADFSVFSACVNRELLLCARRFLLLVAALVCGGVWLRLPVRSLVCGGLFAKLTCVLLGVIWDKNLAGEKKNGQ
jgi:hypothetical protein